MVAAQLYFFRSEISESSRTNSPVLKHLSDVMPHHGPLMTHCY